MEKVTRRLFVTSVGAATVVPATALLSPTVHTAPPQPPAKYSQLTEPARTSYLFFDSELILKVRGQLDRTLKAGDSFFNPLGPVHSLVAAPGEEGGTAVSTWIIDKGKPLATAVP